MNRRDLLRAGAAALLLDARRREADADDHAGRVMTVLGPIAPGELGFTLTHEHILVDFAGADAATPDRYRPDDVEAVALPHLRAIREQGVRTLVECTPAYLARDPALLRRLSEATGLQVLTNTGYYAAWDGLFLPAHARTESADELAARWLAEWRDGIGGTGIRPGFQKIGLDAGPLPEVGVKLVRAAARVHLASGLTIAAHTGDGRAALQELDLLREEGVDPSAFIWVHANAEPDLAMHAEAAARGAWVEFDGVAPGSVDRHVELVAAMKAKGRLGRVLLSHDAGWYHVGEPGGGDFRPFDTLGKDLLPALRRADFTDAEVRKLTVDNPREAFTIRVRRG
ncbi:phosphotriesterase family protein [Paludisphaera soli]|uniref:phosphotriesterase family protein n=1 Tax=Paludisphaera soli TaxID=2712865 RepID=UPI0013ED1F5E|nr:phosphotriesterase [Paludisphaera soli]